MSRGVLITCYPPTPLLASASSGLLFSDNLVLTVGTLLEPFLAESTSATSLSDRASSAHYTVLAEEDGNQRNFNARPAFTWRCPLVGASVKKVMSTWHLAPDSQDNADYKNLLSTFIVLQLDAPGDGDHGTPTVSISRVMTALSRLLLETTTVMRGQDVVVESTPFGRKFFLNSVSEGIVSNILGLQGCLIMSDARASVGCEGGPMFTARSGAGRRLVGLVLASVSWWKGEWVGFTFAVDLRPVLRRIGIVKREFKTHATTGVGLRDTSDIDRSVVLVRCGNSWGSGVVVDAARGLVLTCSHVVKDAGVMGVVWQGVAHEATLVYRTRDGVAYDLALLKVTAPASQWRTVDVNPTMPVKGARVFVVGYPLFDEHDAQDPCFARGVVSHVASGVMMQTTCVVQSGASGGAVLDARGALVGVVSCNARDVDTGTLYPRVNMVVPAAVFAAPLKQYIGAGDVSVLKQLESQDERVQNLWKMNLTISKM